MRRGAVVVIVIWAIAIAASIVAAVQLLGFRQATIGRETLAKVQARWAARAGIEEMIAILAWHAENPDTEDMMAVYRDLEAAADGEVASGMWRIRHLRDGLEVPGPLDEHSRLNINRLSRGELLNLENMTLDVADAIIDWRDQDDEVTGIGAEEEWYRNRGTGYAPRNEDFRHLAELELVAGVSPERLRGEDWNLNGQLDPNEDDRGASFPDDDGNGQLDAGWSAVLTAASRSSGRTISGEERIDVATSDEETLTSRLGVDAEQAKALVAYAQRPDATMEALLLQDLGSLASGSPPSQQQTSGRNARSRRSRAGVDRNAAQAPGSTARPLDRDQLRLVFREASIGSTNLDEGPGKLNLNTASREALRLLFPDDPDIADSIITLRQGRSEGLLGIVDLLDVDKITPQRLAAIRNQVDVVGDVFTISSRGRAESTGLEVEILATVDRSILPVRILEYREP